MLLLLIIFNNGGKSAEAADGGSSGEIIRQATIVVSYTRYEWWLLRWSDNQPICQIFTNHENWPTPDEVYTACGKTIYQLWISTPACSTAEGNNGESKDCIGLYLHFIDSQPAERSIIVDLPPPQVWISLTDCTQLTKDNRCSQIPSLLLTGEEPLPNEHIIALHAAFNGITYHCEGSTCKVPLQATPISGTTVEFWADSSFGDSSEHFTAQVRVIETGVSPSPNQRGWYVDVLSSQWRGKQLASCSQVWDAFPPVGGLPTWLSTPEKPTLLASEETYYYLAGRLIAQGLVDAQSCPAGGLLPNGYADACGLEQAKPLVDEWQNRFDAKIIEVAKETGVPAQLMKNIFAQESQFWPGEFRVPSEYGLGQITDNGAETILLWNASFFDQFCPLVLDASACSRGYVYLSEENRALLRGALALQAKSDCPNCDTGIDLTNVDFSIRLYAQTLLANCSQVSRIVYNATNRSPGSVSDFENLWRFTVANYHIGPGCLSYAIYTTWSRNERLTWENVSSHLTTACQGVINYVDNVTK